MPTAITRNSRWILLVIALLSAGGVVVSSVSLYHHYGSAKSSYCDFGGNFNCDMVNRSIYSTVLGVPVALIGILGYAGLLALATRYKARAKMPAIMLLGSVAGLGFALYLTYIEAYVLAVWCVLCLSSLALITTITGFAAGFFAISSRRVEK